MTSDASTNGTASASSPAESDETGGPIARLFLGVVDALASSKLTAFLIVASIVLVLLGTLAQVYMEIWEVVNDYFRAWVAWVDLKVLFPPSFFPWAAHTVWDSLPIKSFPFPGGASIGLALVINLAAAHGVRFKVQARGWRLVVGILVLVAGAAVTWLVIETGHNRQGLQGEPLLAWSTLWLLMQIGLVALFLTSFSTLAYVVVRVKRKRTAELVALSSFTLSLGVLVGWMFAKGDAAVLNDSSLRILYNLIQGELAALALLAGCVLLFYKRAGITLLHAGVGLMMFGEFFVSYFADEQQMTIIEGQTVSHAIDIRSVELAITTISDQKDRERVVVIPTKTRGVTTRFAEGSVASPKGLPFDVQVVRYHKNSTMRRSRPDEQTLATQGFGLRFVAEEAPPASGVKRDGVDQASAYVKITERAGKKDLGTYLASQHFASMPGMANAVSVGGQTYGLQLRFKRSYKPYQITLVDVRKDDYVGTTMPRNYSSEVILKDPSRKEEFKTKIWMNNPLRYAGETFYQSGYHARGGGKESTTLQIVKNTGWMIPYVSCMIVATGMLVHFLIILLRFLRRIQQGEEADESTDTAVSPVPTATAPGAKIPVAVRWLVPLLVVLVAGAYIGSKAVPPKPLRLQMDLEQFGSLPLMYQGRVKPFDTLARNSLRVLSNRQTFVDSQGQKQPAIRWLLDVIARPQVAETHRVFRIDNPEVLKSLGLERRKGYRYSWSEIRSKSMEFQKQVLAAQRQPAQERTLQQRRLLELRQRVDRYRLLADAFRPLPLPPFPSREETEEDPEKAAKTVTAIERLLSEIPTTARALAARQPPLAAPIGSSDQPWQAYASAKNEAYRAQHYGKKEPAAALTKLAAIFDAYKADDVTAFNRAVVDYKEQLAAEPPAGLDMRITDFEAYFNYLEPFYHVIPLYVFALVLTALAWLSAVGFPRLSALMRSSTFWLVVLALALHTFALAARVVISGRPPVTNLYSSAIFVGWGCVGLGLALEFMFRLGIGNLVSAIAGIGTLIIAHFLAADGDTIKVLQAVLDTQFWLTTHVLTVTLGYSATFLAGLLGVALVVFVLGKWLVFGVDRLTSQPGSHRLPSDWMSPSRRSEVERILGAMIYGTVCFAAIFSLVGTVLGGLWADDSWGRFWGWDPKENGALMVVLWNALVLHARSARMVKLRGLALLAIGGNIVTAWSWFGVNELGVGMHTYGFTEGAARMLWLFWFSQLIIIGLSVLPVWLARLRRGPQATLKPGAGTGG